MIVDDAKAVWDILFKEWPTKTCKESSQIEREEKILDDPSFIYGELPLETLEKVFHVVILNHDEV